MTHGRKRTIPSSVRDALAGRPTGVRHDRVLPAGDQAPGQAGSGSPVPRSPLTCRSCRHSVGTALGGLWCQELGTAMDRTMADCPMGSHEPGCDEWERG